MSGRLNGRTVGRGVNISRGKQKNFVMDGVKFRLKGEFYRKESEKIWLETDEIGKKGT